jgi:septal ring-binding cell division protein DamX
MVITSSPTTARVEQTTSGALITNAGAGKPVAPVAPATAADTSRYEAMAREFAADKSGNFTVQFELVCEPASITKALREGSSNVWFLPISYHGRSCYRVFWGRYSTQQAAQNAISSIPQTLREATPVVVHVPK